MISVVVRPSEETMAMAENPDVTVHSSHLPKEGADKINISKCSQTFKQKKKKKKKKKEAGRTMKVGK